MRKSLGVVRELADGEVARVAEVLGLARLDQGDGAYLVAWDGDEPLGHLHLTATDPPELQDVEVRASSRRRGVATALIAAAEEVCRGRGDPWLHVEVGEGNDAARALYEGLGYRDSGRPPRRVTGTIEIRTGPIEVDDTLYELRKPLA